MIIKLNNLIADADNRVYVLNYKQFIIHYVGFIFLPGYLGGKESILKIIDAYVESGEFPFEDIMGNYFINILDQDTDTNIAFTDNSCLFKAYSYKQCISTSFLEILDHYQDITINDLDPASINEFFHTGFTYGERTLIKGLTRLDGTEYYVSDKKGYSKVSKQLKPLEHSPKYSIEEYFGYLKDAIRNETVSMDLTGGFDSRLVISYFEKLKLDYNDLSVSGQAENKDITIAQKIADTIHKKLYVDLHKPENVTLKTFQNIFKLSDAQIDVVNYHRNHNMNVNRKERGVTLQMGGAGGELYKDYWWLQDFPFYKKKKTNLHRLYDYRIESTRFDHSLLGNKIHPYSLSFRKDTIDEISQYTMPYNTQSYDNIYFQYKMKTNAGVYTTIANNYYFSYCPLLEYEMVKIGYNMKRKDRFFNNWHRKQISLNCPEISKIKTTEDVSASDRIFDKMLDLSFYIFNKLKRLAKQILRKLLNKTYFQEVPSNIQIPTAWMKTQHFKLHVDLLKQHDILSPNVNDQQIATQYVGKITTIGLLVQYLMRS